MIKRRLPAAILLLVAVSRILAAQSSAGTPASVEGRVESVVTGDAVPGASVHLGCMTVKVEGVKCAHMETTARADGTFRFDGVVPGSYLVFASAERFVGMYGTTPSAVLDAGQQLSRVELRMNPEATISGNVVDEAGNATAGVAIDALAIKRSGGRNRLLQVSTATSDASGAYQLARLTPGKYYVSAQPLAVTKDQTKGAIRFYAPSAFSVEQTNPLVVEPGRNYAGTNIRMRAVTVHRIEGKIAGLPVADEKQQKVTLRFAPRNEIEASLLSREVHVDRDGSFAIDDVPAGNYVLQLRGVTPLSAADSSTKAMLVHLLAKQEVDVGETDVTGLALVVPPPITVTGRVVFEGSGNANVAQTQIGLRPADSAGSSNYKNGKAQADGTFRFTACDPAVYAVHVAAPAGTYVRSIEFNRQDAMRQLLDLSGGAGGELTVTLRAGTAELTGSIQADSNAGEQVDRSTLGVVLLIPTDWNPEVWQELPRQLIRNRSFTFKNLAPGRYAALAIDLAAASSDLWQDPDFIRALQSKGQAVDLREGDQRQASLVFLTDADVKEIVGRLDLN